VRISLLGRMENIRILHENHRAILTNCSGSIIKRVIIVMLAIVPSNWSHRVDLLLLAIVHDVFYICNIFFIS
jgi:hypothetical protein